MSPRDDQEKRMGRDDTIFALASGAGRAGVALIRVSGSAARTCVNALTHKTIPAPRRAVLRAIRRLDGELIDRSLMLWFAAPASLTGEDVAEFQVHGGPAIVEALFKELSLIPGVRLAQPGEFTRRAVENGKLDLTQAEAIADLVTADTEAQRRQALRQYDGALSALCDAWRGALSKALAWAEAAIDFSDEELPDDVMADARRTAEDVREAMVGHLDDARRGELVREGLYVAVVGPPNAGKSSLVNALAGRDVAIVSETAGTTRDVIEVRLNLSGYAVVLADTAGLRAANDHVEAEGVRRALARAESADLVVLLRDGTRPDLAVELPNNMVNTPIEVWNKVDLPWPRPHYGLLLSLTTGEGLDGVVDAIATAARQRLEGTGEAPALTRARHREAVRDAAEALGRAVSAPAIELFAEDLRLAVRSLGRITGRVDVEDLLDVIFRDFCIGK
jgi:tRNA modification GTPase